jgi:hypothetical protein
MKGIWINSHTFQIFVDIQVKHLEAPAIGGERAKWYPCERCGKLVRVPMNVMSTFCSADCTGK